MHWRMKSGQIIFRNCIDWIEGVGSVELGRRIMSAVSNKFDLPTDILAGVPRIEMIGSGEVSIEPHKGLIEYGTSRITVSSVMGNIEVTGHGLLLKSMNSQRIEIAGEISSVFLSGDCLE